MDPARALVANAAFYLAFSQRDLETLGIQLAREHPVTSIQPARPALIGRETLG